MAGNTFIHKMSANSLILEVKVPLSKTLLPMVWKESAFHVKVHNNRYGAKKCSLCVLKR